ncbi:MAG: ATP-grasp domain-containing protein, partial [Deltaproteobacteria bacterium]|nr:ATP-grasp domain-containing protein [Deltaproteobacteria bacterium]
MKTIALVAPFFQENTLRYVRALADVGKCQPLLISQDPRERLPADLQAKIAGHYRVGNCMSGEDLARACRAFRKHFGELDGLYGVLEQLQQPMAEARELADVPGMGVQMAKNFRDKAQMKDVLRAAGVPVARHMLVESDNDALDFAEKVSLPIILKPVAGLGSRGTYRIQTDEDLRHALKTLRPSIDAPLQAEEF